MQHHQSQIMSEDNSAMNDTIYVKKLHR